MRTLLVAAEVCPPTTWLQISKIEIKRQKPNQEHNSQKEDIDVLKERQQVRSQSTGLGTLAVTWKPRGDTKQKEQERKK
ncbi:hypothetical protein N7471_011733 [Penicillium samsonianum]|uniref:uncharacterized protein n=1 Tax=Penicillium samsonianum TaxID=1882272 RepID=UPI0025490BD3|nr:uncharacterized protein N7471_011733 [Penicillium samsonianum]KAJ6124416.1 hypothetical protein N7471_011733 [Penicillium samsonianum]